MPVLGREDAAGRVVALLGEQHQSPCASPGQDLTELSEASVKASSFKASCIFRQFFFKPWRIRGHSFHRPVYLFLCRYPLFCCYYGLVRYFEIFLMS